MSIEWAIGALFFIVPLGALLAYGAATLPPAEPRGKKPSRPKLTDKALPDVKSYTPETGAYSAQFEERGGLHGFVFFLGYVLFMLPTYVLPWFGSNSFVLQGLAHSVNPKSSGPLGTLTVLHLVSLLMLVGLASARGRATGRGYLVAFPIVAAVFDMVPVLSLIYLVPTAMHIVALIVGMLRRA